MEERFKLTIPIIKAINNNLNDLYVFRYSESGELKNIEWSKKGSFFNISLDIGDMYFTSMEVREISFNKEHGEHIIKFYTDSNDLNGFPSMIKSGFSIKEITKREVLIDSLI